MAVDFSGKWKLEKNENFEDFLKAMNVNVVMRAAAMKQSPTIEITQNGDDFTVITKSAIRSNEVKFKMGEQFTAKDPVAGKNMNMVATWEGEKQVVKNADDADGVTVTRELEGGKMVQTQTKGGVTCRRIFTKS